MGTDAYPLTWTEARAALFSGAAVEVEAEHNRYLYRIEEGVVVVAPFGSPNWYRAMYEPNKNTMFRISKESHEKMTEPKPMSPDERRRLMHALADGKICRVQWGPGHFDPVVTCKIKLGDTSAIEQQELDGDWTPFTVAPIKWLSWSEVREPMVFEFEHNNQSSYPDGLVESFLAGTRFKVRFEEILE